MKLIAPGWARRETVKIRPLSLLVALATAVVLGSGCEEELAPQITQFVLDPDCEVMRQHSDGVYLAVQYFARASGGNRFDDPTGTNSALEFLWNFGDGSTTKNKVSGFHRYDTPGSYTVKLTVKDKDGDEATIEGDIFVGDFGTELDVLSIGMESVPSTAGIVNRLRGRVARINVSDPTDPTLDATVSLTTVGEGTLQVPGADAAIVDDQLYVAAMGNGLRLIDLGSFAEVNSVRNFLTTTNEVDPVNGITVAGNTAYLAMGNSLLRRLNVSTADNPTLFAGDVAIEDLDAEPGTGQDVVTLANVAFLANLDGLKTVSLSDLGDSLVVGFDSSPGPALAVGIRNTTAYIGDAQVGLGVYDVSAPFSPTRVDWLGTEGRVVNITVDGPNGYLCDENGGFYVLDLSGGAVSIQGYVNTPGAANDVTVADGYAYVANSGGLQIIDIGDPTDPTIVGDILTLGNAVAIVHDGNDTVYVVYNGDLAGWNTPMLGTLTTPCPSSNLVQEFEWEWEFGDGSVPLTHGANPVHLYAPTASITDYWVRLRVTERQTTVTRFDSLLVSVPSF